MSRLVISSQVAACIIQPVIINGHPSIHGHLTGLSKNRPVNFWQWCLVISSFIDGAMIGNENHTLPLCAYLVGFGKGGHICR